MGTLAFCQFCGQRIVGKNWHFRHPDWPEEITLRICSDCADHAPRCISCGLPIAPAGSQDRCVTCQSKYPLCQACGQPISGDLTYFDGAGPFCQTCCYERPPCGSCGAPLTDDRWQLSDGRLICSHCRAGAVFSTQEAVDLFTEIKARLSVNPGIKLNIPTGLFLVDQEQLQEVIRQQPARSEKSVIKGFEQGGPELLGIYLRHGMRRGIYILTGLPRKLFIQTAAHEYAHAWQGENCPTLGNGLVQEGFAEWIAYRAVSMFGYISGLEQMRNRQDIYGEGLRWALNCEDRDGVQAVLAACRADAGASQLEMPEGRAVT